MTVFLVRHGHKALGEYRDPRLAGWLRGRGITAIAVSGYRRTVETARPLARRLRVKPVADSRLDEIDIGQLDGLSDEEVRVRFPEAWRASEERSADFRWPGGETGTEALARIAGYLREQEDRTGNLLVVAHDGIIRLFVCHVLGIPVWRRFGMKIDPVGITELAWDPPRRRWDLVRYNQVP
jgi:broad specificity phosphatase PhoE